MKVSEVIIELQKYDSDLEVWFDVEYAFSPVGSVTKQKHPYPKDRPEYVDMEIIMVSF